MDATQDSRSHVNAQEEIYPMPAFPALQVADVLAATQWYQETLGFHVVLAPGGPGFARLAHLRWAKYADLLLIPDAGLEPGPKGRGVRLTYTLPGALATLDELAARAVAHGATIVEGPVARPWNVRELLVRDPDGYLLVFSEPINIHLSWDELTRQLDGQAHP